MSRVASSALMASLLACATTATYGPTRVDSADPLAHLQEVEPNALLAECLNYAKNTWREQNHSLLIGSDETARNESLGGDAIVHRLSVGHRTWIATGGIERPGTLWFQEGDQAPRRWLDHLPPVAGLLRAGERIVLVAGGQHLAPPHGLIVVWPLSADDSASADARVDLDFAPVVATSNGRTIVAVGRGTMREYSLNGEELRRIAFDSREAMLWPTAALATSDAILIGGGMLVLQFSTDRHPVRWFIPKTCPDAAACSCAEQHAVQIQAEQAVTGGDKIIYWLGGHYERSTTAEHEFGHLVGLGHEARYENLMNETEGHTGLTTVQVDSILRRGGVSSGCGCGEVGPKYGVGP